MRNEQFNTKNIRYPKMSRKLAEFLAICLGDGTMTEYFVRISGDRRYDRKYFEYIASLVYELFGLRASIYEDKEKLRNTFYIQISSRRLCKYLHDSFKLSIGKKRNTIKIPPKIVGNKGIEKSFLRGSSTQMELFPEEESNLQSSLSLIIQNF